MSTQPSSRLRPSTFGTSRRLVRYIFVAGRSAAILSAVFLNALPSAAPNFSADEVTIVLPQLARSESLSFSEPAIDVFHALRPFRDHAVHRDINAGGRGESGTDGKPEVEIGIAVAHDRGLRRAGQHDGLVEIARRDHGRGAGLIGNPA